MLSLAVAVLLFVFTIIGGIFYLVPRLNIAPGAHGSTDNPLSVPLTLTNNGYLTVTIGDVSTSVDKFVTDRNNSLIRVILQYRGTGTLKAGESADFSPQKIIDFPDQKTVSADFVVVVEYHQQFWPTALRKRVRFRVTPDASGALQWLRPFLTDEDRKL